MHKDEIIKLVKETDVNSLYDLERKGVPWSEVQKHFGNFSKLLEICGKKSHRRKRGMSKEEFQLYLKEICIPNVICPGLGRNGPCNKICSCWITDRYHISKTHKRQSINYMRRTMKLYQLSYLLFKGEILPEKDVSHKCDNSLCYNPDHLELLSHQENIQDSFTRGRHSSKDKTGDRTGQRHNLKDPYDYSALLEYVKIQCNITQLSEWLWKGKTNHGYPVIRINKRDYRLHRLILANKLNIKYDDIDIARHIVNGHSGQRHDLNPDHLFNGNRSDNASDDRDTWSLTEKDHDFIFEELKTNKFVKCGDARKFDDRLAKKFGIPRQIISSVRKGESYQVYLNEEKRQFLTLGTVAKPVIQLDRDRNFICRYNSIKEAAAKTNGNGRSISTVCRGEHNTSGGYIWVFEENWDGNTNFSK